MWTQISPRSWALQQTGRFGDLDNCLWFQVASSKPRFPDEFDVVNTTSTLLLFHHLKCPFSFSHQNVHMEKGFPGQVGLRNDESRKRNRSLRCRTSPAYLRVWCRPEQLHEVRSPSRPSDTGSNQHIRPRRESCLGRAGPSLLTAHWIQEKT